MSSYHDQLKALAESIGSDGCSSLAVQVRVECCWEHDWAYVTGTTPRGVSVTKERADQRFRDCLQAHSSLRWLSPLSWWRWVAVSQFGHGIWKRPVVEPTARRMVVKSSALADAQAARHRIAREVLDARTLTPNGGT